MSVLKKESAAAPAAAAATSDDAADGEAQTTFGTPYPEGGVLGGGGGRDFESNLESFGEDEEEED
eukprot:JP447051.1.p4 GENE.JP447051.1~~JP447051.1.p4  ORF type:complete len:65 (+),score=26.45 JP447051.1:270-464(+)